MIEPYIRPFYQKTFCDPLAKKLCNFISPNTITLIGILCGILIIPALLYDLTLWALFLLATSGICDTLDGTLARLTQTKSPFGTVLDIVGDRLVEFFIILGLFLVAPETRAMECLLMLGSILICVTSFLVVGIFSENDSKKGFYFSPGIMERLEAFFFFGLMMLCPHFFQELAFLFSFLVFLTAGLRMIEFKRVSNILE